MATASPPPAPTAGLARVTGGPRAAMRSTIGAKALMALTGLALVLFVIAHMLGNLQIFAGPAQLNGYAHKLQGLGPFLWVMRAGLLAIFALHVAMAARVARANRAARPVAYVSAKPQITSYAARTMLMSGLIVLFFVIYHLLHFTLGVTNPGHYGLKAADGLPDVYTMVVLGFREAPIALAYLVAQVFLALHVSHGASSAFQTLGVTHPRLGFLRRGFGPAVGVLIFVGNASIPLSVLLGWVTLPTGGA